MNRKSLLSVIVFCSFATVIARADSPIDSIIFGNRASETSHDLSSLRTEVIAGGLGESARRLMAPASNYWEGGSIKFCVATDPTNQNYATVKFWGSDATRGMLVLFCDNKQIGYRHLGDVDILDYSIGEPAFVNRFFYTTTPLPLSLTQGKTNVTLEIRSYGPVWTYTDSFEKFQKPMTEASRGIYRIYTHINGTFVPPADEKQGAPPSNPSVAASPGVDVLNLIKNRVNREIDAQLNSKEPCNQMQLQLLARACEVKWTHAHDNPKVIEQIVRGLDALFLRYQKDSRLAEADPVTWNPEWFGLGGCGEVIALRKAELAGYLDEKISDGRGGRIARRTAYAEMLIACRDWHRKHRRLYTNQTMINDLNGIYNANRGIEVVDPDKALSESEARRYLYESVGVEPWRDSDAGAGIASETGRRNWGVGTNYWELTAKGLTRELGYVGSYGEVIDLVSEIYDATRPSPGKDGDEKIKNQLIKIAHARANFRYPSVDENNHQMMRLEQVIGWRDTHYPGYVAYAQRATRDANALHVAAITSDPLLVGASQEMLADNQFFASEVEAMNDGAQPLRTTIGRLYTPDEYGFIKSLPRQAQQLPMAPGQPDFVFSDEDDGVVAIKHGSDILYASLYWRARNAVNSLARVHFTTPSVDHIAVLHEDVQFEPSGEFYTRPNWVNFAFGGGGPKFPMKLDSALAGEKLPIAKIPNGIEFKPGDENVYAGKADFYALRYGDYLIGMNMTKTKSFDLKLPAGAKKKFLELVSRKEISPEKTVAVAPQSTVVLYLGN